jgi:hypothetical protein
MTATSFTYTHGGIEFTFVPYDGWQEDVRTAAAFLYTHRAYSAVAKRLLGAFSPPAPPEPSTTTVHFVGGPWDGNTYEAERVVGPVFAVGDLVGSHYWLDTNSNPPAYHWDGTTEKVGT